MKQALTLIMLAMLIVPLLIGVRRIRRLPQAPSSAAAPARGEAARHNPEERR